jgi:hypothetical protein
MAKCRENPVASPLSRLDFMTRLSALPPALLLAALAALWLSACGSGGGADLLPGNTATEINSNLDQVQELAEEGECIGAQNAAREVSAEVSALGGVDKTLKQALREGADRLNEVVVSCQEAEAEEPAIESGEELEEAEKKAKPEKAKEPKPKEKESDEAKGGPPAALPPESNGKGKGLEEEESVEEPPVEESGGGTSSGGVSPGAPAAEGE